MQTTAIIQAAINVSKKTGKMVTPEIMVPLVLEAKELKYVKSIITTTADKLIDASSLELHYHVGTMIEIPRAALSLVMMLPSSYLHIMKIKFLRRIHLKL